MKRKNYEITEKKENNFWDYTAVDELETVYHKPFSQFVFRNSYHRLQQKILFFLTFPIFKIVSPIFLKKIKFYFYPQRLLQQIDHQYSAGTSSAAARNLAILSFLVFRGYFRIMIEFMVWMVDLSSYVRHLAQSFKPYPHVLFAHYQSFETVRL